MDRDPVAFVLASSVRRTLLRAIADGRPGTEELLLSLEASTSAIYAALDELEAEGLITDRDGDGWRLTGTGRILADAVGQRRSCRRLFGEVGTYLEEHDCSVLPRRFRLRLGDLTDLTVLEAPDTEPARAVSEVAQRIETAETARVISPIYVEAYKEAMPDTPGAKLIVDRDVVRAAREGRLPERAYEEVGVRVADVELALAVTDSALLLSLPTLEGDYDARSELIAESERARQWGAELFSRYWDRATPLDQAAGERTD